MMKLNISDASRWIVRVNSHIVDLLSAEILLNALFTGEKKKT